MFLELQLHGAEAREDTLPTLVRPRSYSLARGEGVSKTAALSWDERMRGDLIQLVGAGAGAGLESWHRLVGDLTAFLAELDWGIDAAVLEQAAASGEQVIVDIVTDSPELGLLPWESAPARQALTYLSDFTNVVVRYSPMGLPATAPLDAPVQPGVLLAWSDTGGPVPHQALTDTLRAATSAGDVAFRELAQVDEVRLQAALQDRPLSVLHLLCRPAPASLDSSMALQWGSKEAPSTMSLMRLARILERHAHAVRLVVLDVCGPLESESPVLCHGLAEPILCCGIPAVVGARAPRTTAGSELLARTLYQSLLHEGRSLEHAARHARTALLCAADSPDTVGDGHGLQLHLRSKELRQEPTETEEIRPILASYPFGTARQPTPAHQAHSGRSARQRAGKALGRAGRTIRSQAKDRLRKGLLRRVGARIVTRAKKMARPGNLAKTAGVIALGACTALVSVALKQALFEDSDQSRAPADTASYVRDAGTPGAPVLDAHPAPDAPGDAAARDPARDAATDATVDRADAGPNRPTEHPPVRPARPKDKPKPHTKKSRSGPAAAVGSRPAGTAPDRVWVAQEALYDIENHIARITWRLPPGAAGVLVVQSKSQRVRGKPVAGASYAPGSPWPHGAGSASVQSAGRATQADFELSPGETIWLYFWAFDDGHDYGPGRPFEWTVPKDLDQTGP